MQLNSIIHQPPRPKIDIFKAWMVDNAEFLGHFELPNIKICDKIPIGLIPFDKTKNSKAYKKWIHFYLHDYKYECLWNNPKAYLNRLQKYDGIISPDFSIYRDMPLAMQIWNTYRSRALAHWFNLNNISVIPNIRWGDKRSYEFCFDGIEKGGVVAVGTHGCIKQKIDRSYFYHGLMEMVSRLSPHTIIVYGSAPNILFGELKESGIKIIAFESQFASSRKRGKL